MSDDEFWSLTLKELSALFDRQQKIEKRKNKYANYRAGIVASTIANCYRDPKRKAEPYQPKDFMPLEDQEKKKQETKHWSEQLKLVEMLNAAFGGEDKRGGAA